MYIHTILITIDSFADCDVSDVLQLRSYQSLLLRNDGWVGKKIIKGRVRDLIILTYTSPCQWRFMIHRWGPPKYACPRHMSGYNAVFPNLTCWRVHLKNFHLWFHQLLFVTTIALPSAPYYHAYILPEPSTYIYSNVDSRLSKESARRVLPGSDRYNHLSLYFVLYICPMPDGASPHCAFIKQKSFHLKTTSLPCAPPGTSKQATCLSCFDRVEVRDRPFAFL